MVNANVNTVIFFTDINYSILELENLYSGLDNNNNITDNASKETFNFPFAQNIFKLINNERERVETDGKQFKYQVVVFSKILQSHDIHEFKRKVSCIFKDNIDGIFNLNELEMKKEDHDHGYLVLVKAQQKWFMDNQSRFVNITEGLYLIEGKEKARSYPSPLFQKKFL